MGRFFSVEFERDLPGADIGPLPVIARASDDLVAVAGKLGVESVWDFYDYDPASEQEPLATHRPRSYRAKFWRMLGDMLARGVPKSSPHEIRWNASSVGLRAFRNILNYVRLNRESLARSAVNVDEALAELDDVERALGVASAAGVRFYLALYT